MALGDKARRAALARAAENRPPTVGSGTHADDQAYRGVAPPTTTDLERGDVETDFRGTDRDKDIPAWSRKAVYLRSSDGGDVRRCEANASIRCTGQGVHLHHRKLRRHKDHRPCNLLDVCAFCHHDIHAHPALSYLRGLMLHAADDPEKNGWTPGRLR